MATDLMKMVEDWDNLSDDGTSRHELFTVVLKAMASQIDGNTEALGHAFTTCNNLLKTCKTLSERIDLLRKEPKP